MVFSPFGGCYALRAGTEVLCRWRHSNNGCCEGTGTEGVEGTVEVGMEALCSIDKQCRHEGSGYD